MAKTKNKYDWIYDHGGLISVKADWVPDPATFSRLDKWYYTDKDYVYGRNPQSGLVDRLTYVDRPTFTVLQNSSLSAWARDKNSVYNYGAVVTEADATSFAVLGNSRYAVDKTYVFFSSADQYFGVYRLVKEADPASFTIVEGNDAYDAQDKNGRYLDGMTVE